MGEQAEACTILRLIGVHRSHGIYYLMSQQIRASFIPVLALHHSFAPPLLPPPHAGSEAARQQLGELRPMAAVDTPELQQLGLHLELDPATGKMQVGGECKGGGVWDLGPRPGRRGLWAEGRGREWGGRGEGV